MVLFALREISLCEPECHWTYSAQSEGGWLKTEAEVVYLTC